MSSRRQQLKQLQLALINAFPSKSSLERLLYYELEKNLNEITKDSDLQDIVFNLIQTAESQGWLEALIRAARKENPGNSELAAIAFELLPLESSSTLSRSPSNSVTVVLPKQEQEIEVSSGISAEYDVFLAHNSTDKLQVRAIAEKLKQRRLKPWLDDEQIPPGRPFQDEIQQAIPLSKSAAIFLGLQGLGRWQVMELRSLISMCVEKNIPVIPVLLPSVNKIPENLSFLREFHYVSFPERIDDENALYLLEWGITGQKPETRVRVIPQLSDDLSSDHGDNYIRLESSPIGDLLSDRTIDSNEQVNFDLTLDVTLTADEMRTGVEKQITIENEIINVKIPTGVTSGKTLRVKGKGKLNSLTQERGNLYLKVKSSITSSAQNVAQDNITVSQGITKESLGIETLGGVMTVIIPSNTSLPAKVSEIFSTAVDGQSNVEIHLLKGNNNLVKDNVSLGTFRIDGIPLAPRGVPQIEVTFSIDESGVISVSAKDKGTGKEASVTLQADA